MASDDSSKGKPKRELQNATLAALEKLAEEAEVEFGEGCAKLKTAAPKIEKVRQAFHDHHRGTLMVRGCTSFQQFCQKRLHRNESSVYRMLRSYIKPPERKKSVPKPRQAQGLLVSPERQEAAMIALDAVSRFDSGKTQEERDAAWREYKQIADGGLKSVIDGDRPSFQKLLFDVLAAAMKLEDAALQLHSVLSDIVVSGMIPEHTALLATVRVSLTGAEELLVAGKELAAVRKRLNIDQPTVQ
jgi:hypothetical protein